VDIVPPKLFKREFVRPKYRRKASGRKPGDRAGTGAAWRALRFGGAARLHHHLEVPRHLPLYRLERMSSRWGATLSRQTMVEWVRIAADWAEPIYKCMVAELLAGGYVQCDETPVKYIDPMKNTAAPFKATSGDEPAGRRRRLRLARLAPARRTHDPADKQLSRCAPVRWLRSVCGLRTSTPRRGLGRLLGHARRGFFEAQGENRRVTSAVLRLVARMYRREREWTNRSCRLSCVPSSAPNPKVSPDYE